MNTLFYHCPVCGNIVMKVVDRGTDLVCCGKTMELMVPKTSDADMAEKHVPVTEFDGCQKVDVKVGSVPHPMLPQHLIRFIMLQTESGIQLKYLRHEMPAAVSFSICKEDRPEAVFEYCNVHGLWKSDVYNPHCL